MKEMPATTTGRVRYYSGQWEIYIYLYIYVLKKNKQKWKKNIFKKKETVILTKKKCFV